MIKLETSKYKTYKFGDIAFNISERVEPSETDLDIYVGLEHLDPGCIHIRRSGIPSDVKGIKLRVYPGDIIFGKRRAYQRKAGLVDFNGICSAHAMVVRANPKAILPELFPFFMHSDLFMHGAVDISEGSLSPTIKWKIIAEEEFKLPPLDEQKRLAELLWSVDGTIESYYNLLNKLIISKNSLLKQNYRDIQKELHAISYIAEINPRIERKNIKKDMTVSFVTMADISKEGYIINKEDRKYSEVEKGFTPFKDGDILFAKITPCMENGKGAIASDLINGLGFGSTELHVIRPKDKDDTYYLYYLTRMFHLRKKAEQLMTGSAGQKRVPSNFFDIYKFNLPEKGKRNNLGDQMRKYDYEIDHLKKNIVVAKNIQKQIINQIFGGKS